MQKTLKFVLPVMLAMVLLIASFPALRATKSISADLSISGTTATCTVNVRPERNTDKVEVSVQLVCGSNVIAEWNGLSSVGVFKLSENTSVKKWKTYTKKTTCSINGTSYSIADVTRKCK